MITLDNIKINKNFLKIFTVSWLALAISACSQTNPAAIKDLSDSSTTSGSDYHSSSTPSGTSSTYSQPPANIANQNKNQTYPITVQDSNNNVVTTTTQERIVYNRNYDDIPKGGYKADTYVVKRGDTLFYIAWITGNDFRSLAAKNSIKAPYELSVGQTLDVSGGTTVVVTQETTTAKVVDTTTKPTTKTTTTTATTTSGSSQPTTTKITTTTTTTDAPQTAPSATVANIVWQWPVKGKLIESFSNATRGIDIAGSLGSKIVSAADGKVVYAGNALPGYGNLIIIKHNDDYLTAYAHNQSILVKEQQDIKGGQQIATMGSTGTSSVRLHFEIRYKAKSVDPTKYLPKQ